MFARDPVYRHVVYRRADDRRESRKPLKNALQTVAGKREPSDLFYVTGCDTVPHDLTQLREDTLQRLCSHPQSLNLQTCLKSNLVAHTGWAIA